MQGRLVPAATGELECSPGGRWRDEFRAAAALRLNHIELVADRLLDSCNPMWSADGRDEIVTVAESTGVEVASLCLNEVLASPIDEMSADLVKRLGPVLRDLPIRVVVVPLLEASDLRSVDRLSAVRSILLLADDLLDDEGRVVVELGLSAVDSLRFLDTVGSPRVGLCYDVGNATAFGFDPTHELRILGSGGLAPARQGQERVQGERAVRDRHSSFRRRVRGTVEAGVRWPHHHGGHTW